MTRSIERLAQVWLAGFVVVAVALAYWQVVRAPDLVAREDNPRRVQAERRVQRGRLLDWTGEVLAVSVPTALPGVRDAVRRDYPHPEAAHVTGYYSLRYGVGGSEAVFDALLRGNQSPLEQLLHRPPVGADVSLSLVLAGQQAAAAALGGRRGAVVVLTAQRGAVRVMVSQPAYDPNRLDDEWDALVADPGAPLLNRAAQGVYPVGDLARWIALTGLLSGGLTVPADVYGAPLETLMTPLSTLGYLATARQLGFDVAPPFPLPTSAGRMPDFAGQGTPRDLAATPLHLARFVAAAAGDGSMPLLRLRDEADSVPGERAFAPHVARALRAMMPAQGDLVGWSGVAQPLETGAEPIAWFVGLGGEVASPLAVVVVIEDSRVAADAVSVAQQTLAALSQAGALSAAPSPQ